MKNAIEKLSKIELVKIALFCAKIIANNFTINNFNLKGKMNDCIKNTDEFLLNYNKSSDALSNKLLTSSNKLWCNYTGAKSNCVGYCSYLAHEFLENKNIEVMQTHVLECINYANSINNEIATEIKKYINQLLENSDSVTAEHAKTNCDYAYYNGKLNKLDNKDCIKFALFCAKTVNPNTKESNHCIELIEKWLVNPNSVRVEELKDASNTAYTAANIANIANATYAAYVASYAAYGTATAISNVSKIIYPAANAAYAAIYVIQADSSKTEVINNYLEELLNPKPVTQNVITMEDYRNQMKLDNVKKLTKEVLTLIEVNPEELVKLLNYDVLNEKMKVLVSNINCLNTIQTDI